MRRLCNVAVLALLILLTATTYLRNREWKDEVALYEASIARDDGNYLPFYFLSRHYRFLGDETRQIDNCRLALARKPDELGCLNVLAVWSIEQNRVDSAKELLRKAYAIDPRRSQTSYNLGFFYERQGELDRALGWYKQALALDSAYTMARNAVNRLARSSR